MKTATANTKNTSEAKAPQLVVPGVYQIPLGIVNAFLLESDNGLVLIDTGTPGSAHKILGAVSALGKQPSDIRQILITHLHADHTGSLAVLKRATGAPIYMHPVDAALVRIGIAGRPMKPAPGLLPRLMVTMIRRRGAPVVEAVETDHPVNDGDLLPIAGGIQVIHTPGHSAGQVAFLWPKNGGVLFAGDVAGNIRSNLSVSIVYEDMPLGIKSLERLAGMSFDTALFGHGAPIAHGAGAQFRQKFKSS